MNPSSSTDAWRASSRRMAPGPSGCAASGSRPPAVVPVPKRPEPLPEVGIATEPVELPGTERVPAPTAPSWSWSSIAAEFLEEHWQKLILCLAVLLIVVSSTVGGTCLLGPLLWVPAGTCAMALVWTVAFAALGRGLIGWGAERAGRMMLVATLMVVPIHFMLAGELKLVTVPSVSGLIVAARRRARARGARPHGRGDARVTGSGPLPHGHAVAHEHGERGHGQGIADSLGLAVRRVPGAGRRLPGSGLLHRPAAVGRLGGVAPPVHHPGARPARASLPWLHDPDRRLCPATSSIALRGSGHAGSHRLGRRLAAATIV